MPYGPEMGGSVNRLVKALIERPQVIDPQVIVKAARQKRVTFSQLLDALGNTMFSESELGGLQSNPQVRQCLEQGYLPTITARVWDRALSKTEDRTADNSGWWTVMVAGTSGRFGLTVPQNGSRKKLIALYAGPEKNAKLLIYDPAECTISEITNGPHCGTASLGGCLGGICGKCEPHKVYDKATHGPGIRCKCDHMTRQR
jgi:hypothetical protein